MPKTGDALLFWGVPGRKGCIHNHVEFNSTNLECDGKFKNFKNSSLALRELNDRICREHGYSVIENPKAKGRRYKEKAAAKRGRSHKERLRQTIDRALPGCKDFEEFLARMRAEGYEVKRRGKSLEFKDDGAASGEEPLKLYGRILQQDKMRRLRKLVWLQGLVLR